ncbi:hypothetical protein L083_7620 [Actinoplanes sp. N902-109]|nr:hypothetical protein L083_7620 [Actinoplanes sp. N902-109]
MVSVPALAACDREHSRLVVICYRQITTARHCPALPTGPGPA